MNQVYEQLQPYLERAMAYQAALILFEWDNETTAPDQAVSYTAKIQGAISVAYQELITGVQVQKLLKQCDKEGDLSEIEQAIIREVKEEVAQLVCIPPEEYRAYKELVSESGSIWARARENKDFAVFAPTLKKIIEFQKKFASYRVKEGQTLYDVMLNTYEKGFTTEKLDLFFEKLKQELVPFFQQIRESGVEIQDDFLTGDYPEEQQKELATMLSEYVGFDFSKGVLSVSAHPFTTALHNHDARITTHYSKLLSGSLFSVIHEAGHGIYEQGIADELNQTFVGQGSSMGMHESQSRFFENIIGRNEAFWKPLYEKLQAYFPRQLAAIDCQTYVAAINKVSSGLIRTEADELSYSLHILIRYELEKELVEGELTVEELPGLWADKYEEYLGIRPEHAGEGVLQDIHWSQGFFGYFPSYALGSAFAAQMYAHMKGQMDFEGLLVQGDISTIREYLGTHIHQYGKVKESSELLRNMTGEDFNPDYYLAYLKEKYGKLYGIL